jgi:hypothetical protein
MDCPPAETSLVNSDLSIVRVCGTSSNNFLTFGNLTPLAIVMERAKGRGRRRYEIENKTDFDNEEMSERCFTSGLTPRT